MVKLYLIAMKKQTVPKGVPIGLAQEIRTASTANCIPSQWSVRPIFVNIGELWSVRHIFLNIGELTKLDLENIPLLTVENESKKCFINQEVLIHTWLKGSCEAQSCVLYHSRLCMRDWRGVAKHNRLCCVNHGFTVCPQPPSVHVTRPTSVNVVFQSLVTQRLL